MDIASVDVGQVDDLLKDFDDFLQTRAINLNVEKMSPEYKQAYDKFNKLILEAEKKLGRQAYFDIEEAVLAIATLGGDAMYKTGFHEGAMLILQLFKD